jgi:integrase
MKGHISRRNKNDKHSPWRIAVDIGPDPVTGRRQQQFETVHGGIGKARERLTKLMAEIQKGGYVRTPRDLTVKDYLDTWLRDYADLHCRPRTAAGYHFIVDKYLSPALGRLPLGQLRAQQIAGYCAEGVREGRAARSVLHDFRLLHKALKDAVQLGTLQLNPCDGVQPPRAVDNEMKFLSPEEIMQLLNTAATAPFPYPHLFRTLIYTGLRRSEALGLTWGNLDLDLCTMRITQTLHRIKGEFTIQPPKTKSGRRMIDLAPSLAMALRDYRIQVDGLRLMLGKPLTDDDFVFAHADGAPLDPPTVTHMFIKTARRASLKVRLHDLRHTYASVMLAAGVNIKQISTSLGHSNISITLNVYSHLLPGAGKTAAEKFDRMLEPWLGRNVANPLPSDDESGTRLEGFEPTTPGFEDRCSIH